ncbi:MAG: HPr family phosphocarrier protein [Lachnospiraceae bacterium]|nr:HPr family phosphocarrier protein [Lachnospiraceae bacterium]
MKSIKIRLNGVDDIRAFVNAVATCEYDLDLKNGRYVVDAKSIMGIFSLDLSTPLELVIYGEHEEEVVERIKRFLV